MMDLCISVGAGRESTSSRIVPLKPSAEALADALRALPGVREGWFAFHRWSVGRKSENWQRASGTIVDLDHHVPDPSGAHPKGVAAVPPEEWRTLLRTAIDGGQLPGNVFHHTLHGERIYFLFDQPVADEGAYKRAYRGACELVRKALVAADIPVSVSIGRGDGYEIDPSVSDLAQWFWSPRATVDGEQRNGSPVVLREEPYKPIDLAADAPPEPQRQETPRNGKNGTHSFHPTIEAARDAYNRDHAQDWGKPGAGSCPAHANKGCFGRLPKRPGKWCCHSSNHPDRVGQRDESGTRWWGDALDLDAYAAQRSTTEHLRAEKYLAEERHEDPAWGDDDPTPVAASWPDPVPLHQRPDLPAFDLNVLPAWLYRFVAAVSTETETDPTMSAIWALSAVAIASAKRFTIERSAHREVHANLWTLTLLGSGTGKSPTLRAAHAPLAAWEQRRAVELQDQIAAEEVDLRIARQRLGHLQRKAAQDKDENERKIARREAETIAAKLATAERIVAPLLSVQSATVARLQELLFEHGGRFALVSDEGSALEDLARFEKSGSPDLSSLNKAYDGDEVRVGRRKREDGTGGDRYIRRAVLTLGLSIQPGRALEELRGARAFFDSGFMQRFFVVFPEDRLGLRKLDKPSIPEPVRAEYEERLNELLDLPAVSEGIALPAVRLAPAAATMLVEWSRETEEKWKKGEEDTLRGWGAKLGDKLVRVAGLLHAGEHRRAPWATQLSPETMARALSLSDFFLAHFRAFLFDARIDPVSVLALRAVAWLRETQRQTFKRSDFYDSIAKNAGPGAARLIDDVLKLLEEVHHIRRARPVPGRGRTPDSYDVNPKIHGAHHAG